MPDTILVDLVRISGFRGINNLEMHLARLTVLIGENNSGKTSVLKALQLVLGDYGRQIAEEDFFIDAKDVRAEEIIVDVRIVAANGHGQRIPSFSIEWQTEFGDKIKAEPNGNQFVGIRTRVRKNDIKGGYECARFIISRWPEFKDWRTAKIKEDPASRLLSVPYVSVEAQRDIHYELKDKHSFAGKVLAAVAYDKKDVDAIEKLIDDINKQAISKSTVLEEFKGHLEDLNQSFKGSGTVEITPFPKKLRDLSKHFSVNFGDNGKANFPMEYHGMGTRSWASMLAVKAFIASQVATHAAEVEPFFPILAAEEPEAHLHPNAQKTLYQQLAAADGQVIVSTHSPYFAAMARQSEIRHLKRVGAEVAVNFFDPNLGAEEQRRLHREIIHSRGELLFSRALILSEGETEEQALPLLFQKYFDADCFVLGVNIIGVGGSGKRFAPFLAYSRDFKLPAFIFSDGEKQIVDKLQKTYDKIFSGLDVTKSPAITILDNGQDFESYLIQSGYVKYIEAAIESVSGTGFIDNWIATRDGTPYRPVRAGVPPCVTCEQNIYTSPLRDYSSAGGRERALNDILSSSKTAYAPAIAMQLCTLTPKDFPQKIIEFFEKIKKGCSI